MITPITLIKLNEQSDNVANLHVAMKALDLAVAAKEVAEHRAGASTLKLVRTFQRQNKITFDEKLLVDEPTAAVMNKLLTERGLLKPAPPVVEVNRDFIVKGTITTTNGDSVRDLMVLAFDQDLRSRQQLGTTRTNAKGEYSISYSASQFSRAEKDSADLVVEIRSAQGETLFVTDTLFNAPAIAEIDITLDGSTGLSEFERITSEIKRLIDADNLSLLALEENDQFKDVTFISGETGIDKEKVAHFIIAHKLAERSKIDAEFWYASLHGRVFAGPLATAAPANSLEQTAQIILAAVASTNVTNVERALNTALTDNLINTRFAKSVAAWLKQFRDCATKQVLNSGDASSPSDLKQILNVAGLAETKQAKFAQLYVDSGSARDELIKRLRQDKSFTAAEVDNIEKTLVLNDLTLGSVPLMHTLGSRVKNAAGIRELAKTPRGDWEKLLLNDPRGGASAAPDFIAGGSAEEKAKNYATLLTERFTTEYPTAAFAGGLERAIANKETLPLQHADTIVEFLNSHPEFELHTTAIESFVKKNAGARLSNSEDREGFIQELKATQRLFKLNQSFEGTSAMLADGIHSAQQIYRMGQTKFVSQYGNKPGFTEATAQAAFQRAANTHAAVTTLVGQLAAMQNANAVQALASNSTGLNNFPNLQNLFGKADICECEHCRSVYSPAAYFADVLMFLNDRESVAPAVSVKQVLFERRPDIGDLELSCENSNTPLPYVDLACEVLEDRVAPWRLFNLPLSVAPSLVKGLVGPAVQIAFGTASPAIALSGEATISDKIANGYWVIRDLHQTYKVLETSTSLEVSIMRQTHNSAEELAANPEYVNEAAYAVLRAQKYPFGLPFDFFTEELRAHLEKLNIKRAELMEIFQGTQAPNNPTTLDIAAEYFGIAKDEQTIILLADATNQFVYWGEANNADVITNLGRVDVFLQRTGLEYNDLLKLLTLEFINPNGNISVIHLDSSCDTNQKRIQVLDATSLDGIHRFLRLWRKLGWKMWEVDLVVRHPLIGNGAIDNGFIERLKPFAELKAKFPSLTTEQLCAFFEDLNTRSMFTESYQTPGPSLYERMFLNKTLTNPVNAKFAIDAVTLVSPTETLDANLPPILAALRVNEADLTTFRGLKQPANGPVYIDAKLSLKNLSFLYRHVQLAKLLKLKATEWQTLLFLAQVDPFQSTQATLDFIEMIERVKACGFNVDEVSYLLAADLSGKTAQPEKNVALLLANLRKALQQVAKENDASDLPSDEDSLENLLTSQLQSLGWDDNSISSVRAILRNEFQADVTIATLPTTFVDFPQAIKAAIQISFDNATKRMRFTGLMTATERNTLLTDTSLSSLTGIVDYQNAINDFYDAPRLLLKFFQPDFAVPLVNLPFVIDFKSQLPKELAARVSYDPEQSLLRFAGIMSALEKAALDSLSVDPSYLNAVLSLYDQPRTGVFTSQQLWLSDVDLVFPLSSNIRDNLTTAVTGMFAYLKRTFSNSLVVQQLSVALGVSPAIVRYLLTRFQFFGGMTMHPLLEDFTDASFVASTSAIVRADPAYQEKFEAFYWLHRVTLIIRKLKMGFSDLEWMDSYHVQADALDLKTLPLETTAPLASLPLFLNFADYMKMHHQYSDDNASLLDVVETLITDPAYDNQKFGAEVELLTGWNAADITQLTDAGVLDTVYPTAYTKIENWKRLAKAMAITTQLNGSVQSVMQFAAASVGQAETLSLKEMLRSKYELEQWLDISRGIQDELRERKRDSLVAYLLTQPMPADAPTNKWENSNDLYAYYLIDVEMCSCQLTSRVVQALAAIQLFVQRCFMGLEPQVRVSAEEDDVWTQWKWMKNYRVWEANRKVFLYPENWILPELRRDKSQIFKDLENALLQNEVNRDNVETAFLDFIEKLDNVAQLEIAGTFYQEDNHTLHVFARTPGSEPHTYYYRQWIDDRRWTPWSKVECDIQGDYLIPIIMEQRPYLVWPEFREEPVETPTAPVPNAGDPSFQVQKPLKSTRIHLAITEYRNNKWSAKRVSKDFIDAGRYQGQTLDKSHYLFLPLDFTHLPDGKSLIYFLDLLPAIQTPAPPPPQIFELLGCKGYPEKFVGRFNFVAKLTDFARDEISYLKNNESSAGDALIPSNSRNLQSMILEKTPDYFKINYPHYLSYFDKLYFGPSTDSQPGSNIEKSRFTLGTFYNWFYADKTRTFFVRPELLSKERGALFYKDLEAFVKDMIELIQAGNYGELSQRMQSFFQSSYQFRLLFQNFYHPHTCLFTRELYNHGVDGLMSRATQFADNKLNFTSVYGPTTVVNPNYPQEVVDFTPDGSYSQYNWELFFHAPLMIAMRLSQNQRFEEAMQWFHYIFDPTGAHDRDPITSAPAPAPQKYWNTKPFFQTTSQDYANQRIDSILNMLADDPANPTDPAVKQELVHQVADWRANPFDPHLIAQFRTVAYQKTTVMKYIDNLIAWGDQLFRQDTMESVNEAAQLYVLAAEILGPRPRKVPPPQKPAVESFNELEGRLDAFSNAIVEFENLVPVVPSNSPPTNGQPPLPGLLYFCIPQNDQLLSYWDTVADRLYKIRHCLNIEGVFRQLSLFAPPIDPGALVKAVAAGVDISSALNDLNAPLPHYRFNVMLQKANEVVNDVKALGGALLSALEKKDAEALALLRQRQELTVLNAATAVREKQVEEAKENLEGVKKSKVVIETRRDYYRDIERLSASEKLHIDKLVESQKFQEIAQKIKLGASIISLLPSVDVGASGVGGSPVIKLKWGGLNLGQAAGLASEVLSFLSLRAGNESAMASSKATFERRSADWDLQLHIAEKELDQIDSQIAAAELRIAVADQELQNHLLQIENSKAIDDFMHSKYTNQELYDWMIGQISQVYFQSYQLAYDLAKRAEKCFQYELGVENTSYIQFGYWDSLRKGLLSGEKLQYDLRRLDTAYIDQNRRELELTKNVSLALIDPAALLQLKANGWCFFDLPEELFDLDYQGHYFRRIKSMALSIPCVVGPYTTVNATLRLIKNSVRINTQPGEQYEHNREDNVFTDDVRFRDSLVNVKAIATSSAQNDSGMFDLNFRDERYLPFEGAGAFSTWKLELTDTKELRQFDYESISDVIIHMKYTAREDVGPFKQAAVVHLTTVIKEAASQLPLRRLFNLKHEFPTEWYALFHPPTGAVHQLLLQLKKEHFPFFTQERDIQIGVVSLLLKSKSTDLKVQLDPPAGNTNVLTLSEPPNFKGLHVGPRDYAGMLFDESTLWSIQIHKGSGGNDDVVEADIEECFLIMEYTLS